MRCHESFLRRDGSYIGRRSVPRSSHLCYTLTHDEEGHCRCGIFLDCEFRLKQLPRAGPAQPTPPMGWNSWDAYGFTIDEDAVQGQRHGARRLSAVRLEIRRHRRGLVHDQPLRQRRRSTQIPLERKRPPHSRSGRYPSAANGAGFKPLADWVHAQGLKFGIHIVRGIPRQVVDANLPIAGTHFHASDAADTTSPLPMGPRQLGHQRQRRRPGLLRFHDQALRLLGPRFPQGRLHQRPSLPPHGDPPDRRSHPQNRPPDRAQPFARTDRDRKRRRSRQSTRRCGASPTITGMAGPSTHTPDQGEFPFGLRDEFDRLAKWLRLRGPATGPTPTCCPSATSARIPAGAKPASRVYTPDEERTEFTLWAISRSPLILGANLTRLDDFTRSLITNQTFSSSTRPPPMTSLSTPRSLGPGFENARSGAPPSTSREQEAMLSTLDFSILTLHPLH